MDSYSQIITPATPILVVIAIDQSGSMQQPFENCSMIVSKSEIASILASSIIEELISRSSHRDKSRHYFDLSVVGYARNSVYPLLCDSHQPVPAIIYEDNRPEIEKRTIEYISKDNHLQLVTEAYYEWIKPQAAGPTAMLEMLDCVSDIVGDWCENRQNYDSFPPIVINITDGLDEMEYTALHSYKSDCIKRCGTKHGKTLFFNVCIDSYPQSERLYFPSAKDVPATHAAAMLAKMSSPLPSMFNPLHRLYNGKTLSQPPYLALCYNQAILDIVPMLNIAPKLPEE